jgi:hypothetical protein
MERSRDIDIPNGPESWRIGRSRVGNKWWHVSLWACSTKSPTLATIQRKHKRQFPSIEYPRYSVGSHPQLHRGPVSANGSLKNSTLRFLPHHKSTSASDNPIYLRLHSFHVYHFSTTMCAVTAFKSATCPHKWLTITQPFGPGMGFAHSTRHTFTGWISAEGQDTSMH